jgi:hypothetical protein
VQKTPTVGATGRGSSTSFINVSILSSSKPTIVTRGEHCVGGSLNLGEIFRSGGEALISSPTISAAWAFPLNGTIREQPTADHFCTASSKNPSAKKEQIRAMKGAAAFQLHESATW